MLTTCGGATEGATEIPLQIGLPLSNAVLGGAQKTNTGGQGLARTFHILKAYGRGAGAGPGGRISGSPSLI